MASVQGGAFGKTPGLFLYNPSRTAWTQWLQVRESYSHTFTKKLNAHPWGHTTSTMWNSIRLLNTEEGNSKFLKIGSSLKTLLSEKKQVENSTIVQYDLI